MAKKKSNRRSNKPSGAITGQARSNVRTEKVEGSTIVSFSFGVGAAMATPVQLQLGSFGTRLTTYATMFEEYRWMLMKASFLENTQSYALGCDVSDATTAPTTFQDVVELGSACLQFTGQTVPACLSLGPGYFRKWARSPWFLVNSLTNPGVLYMARSNPGAGGTLVTVKFDYYVEFAQPVAVGNSDFIRSLVINRNPLVENLIRVINDCDDDRKSVREFEMLRNSEPEEEKTVVTLDLRPDARPTVLRSRIVQGRKSSMNP